MKVISRLVILAAVALVIAANVTPVSATCSLANVVAGCGGVCKYIYVGAEGTNPGASLQGNFWGLGGGNPAVGSGDDNGADLAQGNSDPGIDWVKTDGNVYYLAGAWANANVDGCVDNATTPSPKRTVVAISEQAAGKGYFAVLCNEKDAGGNYYYDGTSGQHVMLAIPKPVVTNSVKAAGTVTLTMGAPSSTDLAAATYALAGTCTGLIRGYKVCTSTQNADLSTAAWTCGSENAIGATSQAAAPCAGGQLYVANALVFESGFTSFFVSEPRQVSCDPNMADRPGNMRLIKKPAKKSVTQQ